MLLLVTFCHQEKKSSLLKDFFFTGQNKFSSNVLFERKLPEIPICLKQSSSVVWNGTVCTGISYSVVFV